MRQIQNIFIHVWYCSIVIFNFVVFVHRFAAKIILFALSYKKKIDTNELSPDIIPSRGGKATPLCMDTYHHFFPAYRRPGEQKDEAFFSDQQDSKHPWNVIVACKNQVRTLCSLGKSREQKTFFF
ncbi:choline O-acetyltransferase [Caerostris darwini]|uniref:Choline O-acetyltransferase n=1 Tax=Caerostris darwini TaxID=1538125 RepID=A0AAV4R580_9ARAC|nr:choline O-acetyltransferase [Caerostris darwini]